MNREDLLKRIKHCKDNKLCFISLKKLNDEPSSKIRYYFNAKEFFYVTIKNKYIKYAN